MADTFTPNYNFCLPAEGGSPGTWDTKLNANFTDIDTDLKAVSDVADTATTNVATNTTAITALKNGLTVMTKVALVQGGTDAAMTATVDISAGSFFQLAMVNSGSASRTLTLDFSNRPAGSSKIIWLHLTRNSAAGTTTVKCTAGQGTWAIQLSGSSDTIAGDTFSTGTFSASEQVAFPVLIIGS